jgi:hypothetical protein
MAYIPLSSRGSDTDNHDGGIGQNLLQVLIVLALIQAVSQLLERKVEREDLWELRKVLEALLLRHPFWSLLEDTGKAGVCTLGVSSASY